MSGGYFNYDNLSLEFKIFGNLDEMTKDDDPFDDMEISKLVNDAFRAIAALDYYKCGDMSEEKYRETLAKIKEKI